MKNKQTSSKKINKTQEFVRMDARSEFITAFVEHIRICIETQDPAFLALIERVRTITSMVEEGAQRAAFPSLEAYGRESRKSGAYSNTDALHQ